MTWKYATNISTSWCYCRLFSWATRLKRRPRQCLYSILRDNENSCDDGRLALCDVVVKRLRTKQHDISTFASPTILVYLRDYERSPTDRPTDRLGGYSSFQESVVNPPARVALASATDIDTNGHLVASCRQCYSHPVSEWVSVNTEYFMTVPLTIADQ